MGGLPIDIQPMCICMVDYNGHLVVYSYHRRLQRWL